MKKYRPLTLDEAHKALKRLRGHPSVVDPLIERAYEKTHRHLHDESQPEPKSDDR